MSSLGLSSAFAVFDVGRCIAEHESSKENSTYCSQGMLFLSSPVATANDVENLRLRNELRIVTLIDTEVPDDYIYRFSANTQAMYLVDSFFQQKIMGLTLYHVQFRVGDYIQDIMNELPANVSKAILARAARTGDPHDTQTKHHFQSRVLSRTSIEDSFAILTKSMAHVQLIFNTALCDRRAYPLLLSGDSLLRDNSLLLFLLLSVLEVPIQTIDDIHCAMLNTVPVNQTFRSTEYGSRLCEIWLHSPTYWAHALKDQLDLKFGSVTQYLITAGVSEATQTQIRNFLQSTDTETQEEIDPPPAYDDSSIEL